MINIKEKGCYAVINATACEEVLIRNIISYIQDNYSDKINIENLHEVCVFDELSNGASGRAYRNTLNLARENGLYDVNIDSFSESEIRLNEHLKCLVSTIYHELWHISTWDVYLEMYEYVMGDGEKDLCLSFAYMYWIEYIAHLETVFMESKKYAVEFCENFVKRKWHLQEWGYSYFIKALPYYLVRAEYFNVNKQLIFRIESEELRGAVVEFGEITKNLLSDNKRSDIEKAHVIRDKIEELCS